MLDSSGNAAFKIDTVEHNRRRYYHDIDAV